ncbi:LysR substrate-binding domain-containing protein [Duganella radicis]|uniref:LysR family transcriptional regulator n=1 Tax=Duganella radicis TaxID=551988 RepID=A0A6L6PPL1_9BURK|nr:LysR substrate-binding domain-containing protein [Duganella radicis]MTV41076.1 LysR family transcriptional regulator [Duganella radicis]
MELRHLRYFKALSECLNFTRAAERMHVTQSTLSHQIKQLEESLDRPLFDRIGKRVVLTEAGEIFLEFVTSALAAVDQGIGALKESAGELTGHVRVGATHTFNLQFLPECIATFLEKHPLVRVTVEELPAEEICVKLNSGELDLGIAYRPNNPDNLWFEPLHNEEMILVVSEQHPFANRKRIRFVELHRQQLVLLPEAFSTRAMLDECFRACGAEPLVMAEMNTVAPMLQLVARTQIAAIVTANAIDAGSDLHVVMLEDPTPVRTPGILWNRGAHQQTVHIRSFSSIIRKLALSRRLQAQRQRT